MRGILHVLPVFALFVFCGFAGEDKTVRDFGAIGDGKADDTAAIQKAVDSGIGGVRFTRGVYRISKPVVVDLDKTGFTSFISDGTCQIVMAGAGPAFRFVGTHTSGTASPTTFKPNVWERQRTPMVDGVEIVGAHPEAVGIEANGTMQITITRCVIRECLHGIHLVNRNRNVLVANCHIYNNRGIGVFYDEVSLHQSNIVGSHISYCDGGGIVARGGDVRNIQIGTCDIESNMSSNTSPTANILIDCTTSPSGTAEVEISGCTIQHNSVSPGSANIRILGRGTKNRKDVQERWGHTTITGNVMSDVRCNVHLVGCRGIALAGNTLWMGFEHNLLVEDCAQIVLGANVLERNPGYNYGKSATTINAVVFRNCADCTVNGLHVEGVHTAEAGVVLENCTRFNFTGCTILDCENAGLIARNLTNSRISDCLIRDDRKVEKRAVALKVIGGSGNQIVDNNVVAQ